MSLRRNVFRPVWPDDGIKSCPIFHNIVLKSSQIIFTRKLYLLKLPKNLPEYFGYYFKIKWLPRSLKSPNLVTLLPTIPSYWENPLKKVCIRRPKCKCKLGLSLSLSLSLFSLQTLQRKGPLSLSHSRSRKALQRFPINVSQLILEMLILEPTSCFPEDFCFNHFAADPPPPENRC